MDDEQMKAFVEEQLHPSLEVLEEERKKLAHAAKRNIGLGLIPGIFFATIIAYYTGAVRIAGLVLIFFPTLAFTFPRRDIFIKKFQTEVVTRIFQAYHFDLQFQDEKMPRDEIYASGLFQKHGRTIFGNVLSGKSQGIAFDLCRFTYTGNQNGWINFMSNSNTSYTGLFLRAKLPYSREAGVWVFPDRFPVPKATYEKEKVVLESLDFDTLFQIRGDQIQAREIFTPLAMERLMQASAFVNDYTPGSSQSGEICMSFVEEYVYLFIPHAGLVFEPSIFESLLLEKNIEKYEKQAKMIFHVLALLDLSRGTLRNV
ncbi:MAG TPA: DUF3137 domain-containing protein [Candidatus Paceibacterota bacterium]|nr:DUF3137 domain-containing protein [Candidatus Paceibacterota bacterium]